MQDLKSFLGLSQLNEDERKGLWAKTGPIEIRMIEKNGKCPHNLGDTYSYETPYKRPAELCHALVHVLDAYIWRAALGFPSWEDDDRRIYRIHCPSKKGTVWEMKRKEI